MWTSPHDGVGRPTFDFHADANVHVLVRARVAVDLQTQFLAHVLVDGAHAFAHGGGVRAAARAGARSLRSGATSWARLPVLPGFSDRAPDGCDAFRAPAVTRRHVPGGRKAAREPQACGQSTALIWFWVWIASMSS